MKVGMKIGTVYKARLFAKFSSSAMDSQLGQ